jgi:hypothetical protein
VLTCGNAPTLELTRIVQSAREIRRSAQHLDLQNELPERVPNRAFCAFVKPVAASPWRARSVMLTCFCPFAGDAAGFLLRQHSDARRQGDDPAVWK